jgi:hypothetical protein
MELLGLTRLNAPAPIRGPDEWLRKLDAMPSHELRRLLCSIGGGHLVEDGASDDRLRSQVVATWSSISTGGLRALLVLLGERVRLGATDDHMRDQIMASSARSPTGDPI